MKEQQNNTKDRLILALTDIIALLLTIEPAICTNEKESFLSMAMATAAVVLSAIVVICRWNIRKVYAGSTNIIDIFISVIIWLWTVYSLINVM